MRINHLRACLHNFLSYSVCVHLTLPSHGLLHLKGLLLLPQQLARVKCCPIVIFIFFYILWITAWLDDNETAAILSIPCSFFVPPLFRLSSMLREIHWPIYSKVSPISLIGHKRAVKREQQKKK